MPIQQIDHRPTKILITGKSGSGKSTYYTRFLDNCDYDKIFIYDHEGEYSVRSGVKPCTNMDELLKELDKRIIVYDPTIDFQGNSPEGFNFFCEWVFEISRELPGKKLFATDELQKILGTSTLPWEFCCIIETGRRAGIDTVFVCQQPNLFHNRLRNQLTELVTFRQIDKRALAFLEELGFDPHEVLKLDVGQFQLLDLDTMTFHGGKFSWSNSKKDVDVSRDTPKLSTDRGNVSAEGSLESSESDSEQ
jgi:hypothetical protein